MPERRQILKPLRRRCGMAGLDRRLAQLEARRIRDPGATERDAAAFLDRLAALGTTVQAAGDFAESPTHHPSNATAAPSCGATMPPPGQSSAKRSRTCTLEAARAASGGQKVYNWGDTEKRSPRFP